MNHGGFENGLYSCMGFKFIIVVNLIYDILLITNINHLKKNLNGLKISN
jgi:hypothetical protein